MLLYQPRLGFSVFSPESIIGLGGKEEHHSIVKVSRLPLGLPLGFTVEKNNV